MILIIIEALCFLTKITGGNRMRFVATNSHHLARMSGYFNTAISAAKNAGGRMPLLITGGITHNSSNFSALIIFLARRLHYRRSLMPPSGLLLILDWKDSHLSMHGKASE